MAASVIWVACGMTGLCDSPSFAVSIAPQFMCPLFYRCKRCLEWPGIAHVRVVKLKACGNMQCLLFLYWKHMTSFTTPTSIYAFIELGMEKAHLRVCPPWLQVYVSTLVRKPNYKASSQHNFEWTEQIGAWTDRANRGMNGHSKW